jgi:hypothetical protein
MATVLVQARPSVPAGGRDHPDQGWTWSRIRNAGRGKRDSIRACSPTAVDALISEQIIPRLLMAQAHGLMPRDMVAGTQAVDPAEAAKFASLPLELEADELLVLVEGILARGASVRSVFIDLLAPSARRLGQHWEDDDCDFVDVTMGLWRLQEVMREVTLRFPPPRAARPAHGPRCLPRCPATRTVSAR